MLISCLAKVPFFGKLLNSKMKGLYMSFISFLQTAASSKSSTVGGLMSFLPFVIIIVIFYFFLIRPQNKKQKETEKMLAALKKGDKVVTIGGIHGVVSSVKEKTVIVKVDDNAKIEFTRSAIASVEGDKVVESKTSDEKKKNSKKEKSEEVVDASNADASAEAEEKK